MRSLRASLLPLALLALISPFGAPARLDAQAPVVEEQLEVREVGVVGDLPASLRGRTAAELANRLTILEGGIERRPTSVAALGGEGTNAYARVLVLFDTARCSQPVLEASAAALGAAAGSLTALGPVEVALLGETLEPRAAATLSSSELAATLGRISRETRCGAPPPPDRLQAIALDAAKLNCPGISCLLVWAGPGWGAAPGEGGVASAPAPPAQVEPLARSLASRGWVFLAAPIAAVAPPRDTRSIQEPETQPGSDRHTFGINVLERRRNQPLSADEYSKFVDVWLAPLRQLVAATAGEFVVEADGLAGALESLAGRSVLYYRTDRRPADEPPRLVVRSTRGAQEAYRVAAWAPAAK